MIHDLDKTLKGLLAQSVSELEEEDVRFEAPDAEFAPPLPAVNLFLYDVRENRELRSGEPLVERQTGGTFTRRSPPVRVGCSYLITAWAGDIESEHRLLGRVMEALLRYPVLPLEMLAGELSPGEHEEQAVPLPTAALQAGYLQSLGEFWQALGGQPRAALNYTVTISVQPREPVEAGPPVTDKIIKLRQKDKVAP